MGNVVQERERDRMDQEWKRINDTKEELMQMMKSLQPGHRVNLQSQYNPLPMAGWGPGLAPPQTLGWNGWGPLPNTQSGVMPPFTQVTQTDAIVPSTQRGGVPVDKKALRRERERKKKEERDAQEARRLQQEEAQQRGAVQFADHVKKREQKRSRLAKKKGGGTVAKPRVVEEPRWKVKKHSFGLNQPIKALMKFGGPKGEERWVTLDEIWEPANITTFVPAWRQYCAEKRLPTNWGGGGSTGSVDGVGIESVGQKPVVGSDKDIGSGGGVPAVLSR
jgi:hypothetical protein